MKKFRTELNKREQREALQNLGKPRSLHQATLCFGGLKFVKAELDLKREISRSEIKELEEYFFEKLKLTFKGLTRVIVHN